MRGRISFVSIHTRPTVARYPSPEVYRADSGVRASADGHVLTGEDRVGKGLKGTAGTCDPLFGGTPDAHMPQASLKRPQIPFYYANLPPTVVLGFLRNALSQK